MDKLINRFIDQIKEGIIISEKSTIGVSKKAINKVFITGMGGSGIAGSFASKMMMQYGTVPVFISNSYDIPNWVDENTLAIVSSYSGNTEETLASFYKLLEKDTKLVCISSGGELLEQAIVEKLDVIKLPGNWPAPRACFGYSFIAQLFTLYKLDLLKIDLKAELKAVVDILQNENDFIQSKAKEIAKRLSNKFPVIYSDNSLEPVSIRFKQQLNENSKSLAHHSVFPEMNHNELVGWASKYNDLAVVILRSSLYSDRVNTRIDLSKDIIINYVNTIIEIEGKGEGLLEQLFYLVYMVDWISWHIADVKGVDAMQIDNIIYLKEQLSKL